MFTRSTSVDVVVVVVVGHLASAQALVLRLPMASKLSGGPAWKATILL